MWDCDCEVGTSDRCDGEVPTAYQDDDDDVVDDDDIHDVDDTIEVLSVLSTRHRFADGSGQLSSDEEVQKLRVG